MFRILQIRTMGIYLRTERLGQLVGIKIVFLSQLPMFGGILLKTS